MTRYTLTALTALFLFAFAAPADDHIVAPGKIADVKYDVAKGDKSTLRITPAPIDKVAVEGEPGRFIFTGKDGTTYRIHGYVVNFKTQKFIDVDDTVTFGGKKAEPDDDKKVDPKPAPAGPFWILVVEESQSRSVETAQLYADTAFWSRLTDAGHKWRIFDKDNPEAVKKGYPAKLAGVTLPGVLVLDGAGNEVNKFPLSRAALDGYGKR